MKKIFYLFICLMLFASCDNLALRKDKTERVTFNNIPNKGSYNIYIRDLTYPESQDERIKFLDSFSKLLQSREEKNFLISPELNDDINAIIEDKGVGIERSFFKSASFINIDDKKIINREVRNIKTPKNAGKIQEYLNKQYYYLLTLVGREDEYNKDSYYTEFDKKKICETYIRKRITLKKELLKNRKNFIVKVSDINNLENYEEKLVYLEGNYEKNLKNINSPIVILKNNKYTGYTVNQNNLILFTGNGKTKMNSFIGYDFNVKIIESDKVKLLKNMKQLEISALLSRSKYIPKRPLDV